MAVQPGATQLAAWLGGDIDEALDNVGLPSWIIDSRGVVRWQNRRSKELFGDRVGESSLVVFAPESRATVRAEISRKVLGSTLRSDYGAMFKSPSGRRVPVEIHTVAMREGDRVVGIFGLAEVDAPLPPMRRDSLTPRQLEVLGHLSNGCSTDQIAKRLHLSPETVRNHVRGVLRSLGVHSRLEAVVEGRRRGLIG